MFRIKICGITTSEDAVLAAGAGASAIGLNFYPQSPRCVSEPAAQQIVGAIPESVEKVGVFVNASSEEVCRLHDALGLDWIQLHGDEPPEFLVGLGSRSVVRAFRVGPEGMDPTIDYLLRCSELGRRPDAVLIDARSKQAYGGTGKLVDWQAVQESKSQLEGVPLILAGGLTSENVAEAIGAVSPDAVDTASGVESAEGEKDPHKIRAFVDAARRAYPT